MIKYRLLDETKTPFIRYTDIIQALHALIKSPDRWAVLELNGRKLRTIRNYVYTNAQKMGHGVKVKVHNGRLYLKLKPISEIVPRPPKAGLGKVTNDILRNLGK